MGGESVGVGIPDTAGDTVELMYRPVAADFTAALRARHKVGRLGWLQRWAPYSVGISFVVWAALFVARGETPPVGWTVGLLLAVAVLLLSPWLSGRQLQRLSDAQGVFRATVTEDGLTLANDTSSASLTWAALPRYLETPRLFVLLSADPNATGFTVLPKHGLPDRASTDRLRGILDRHITRC
ncbi:YcxB family protein [Streptomyces seoulensis]|uniref:YcxB family protein n=1 Tax=Streptomyces seoulensis TaxID=73044 RepID=UPI0033BCC706